jgi:NDP-sugar pyrophosphorylase family protein
MRAMIFAAGLGTRLRPLTDDRPKALVKVGGKPLLAWTILRLKALAYRQLVINVHHFADQIEAFLAQNQHFGLEIQISDERDQLLETGGGLKKAAPLLKGEDSFLLCNSDILTDFSLKAFRQRHLQSGALATLAVSERQTSRYLLFDEQDLLCGWKNVKTGALRMARQPQGEIRALAFSGYHYLQPDILDLIEETGKFSIIELYLRLAARQKIRAFDHSGAHWEDMGRPEKLALGADLLHEMDWSRSLQDYGQD